jgi:hypothetical protein
MTSTYTKMQDALLERVIPLPKQAAIAGTRWLRADRIRIVAPSEEAPVRTAVRVLQECIPGASIFAAVETDAAFTLRLNVQPDDAELLALPNADQAYRIRPVEDGLELVGTTAVGVLYAARTLAQLVQIAPSEGGPAEVEIPLATILDWPDLAERGEWGGNAAWDLDHTAPLKLNLVEVGVIPGFDAQGKLRLTRITPALDETARALGVKALPYVPHLGDLGKTTNLFQWRPELMGTPDPNEPLPPDYKPSICFSTPAAAAFLAELMDEIIETLDADALNIWLTEEGVPCFCDHAERGGCRGQNTYVLEARLLAAAYRLVKARHPNFTLRILLTQGSYPVNDQVLAELPADMGATYYSGTHTYDSSHKPMIYELLESYIARGGWLGVYPQVDNSWRTVWPFTGPQFIRARMQEFVHKGLQSVTGYATPSNRFWDFNVAGLAEWGWNADGRDAHAFARAWAVRRQRSTQLLASTRPEPVEGRRFDELSDRTLNQGMADPEGFARWACLIGPLGWDLAGSRFPMRLFWDPATTILDGSTEMRFGDGLLAEIPSAEHLQANIESARQALALAQALGDPARRAAVAESQVVLNAYLFLQALKTISDALRLPSTMTPTRPLAPALAPALAALDVAAEAVVRGLWEWGCLVYPQTPEKPQHRFEETMSVFAQVVTEAYRSAGRLGIADPRPAYRDRPIGGWSAADFTEFETTLRYDVTDLLTGPGPYRVLFRFTGGAYGLDIIAVAIMAVSFQEADAVGEREVARIEPKSYGYGDSPPPPHIGRYEAWNDVRLDLAEVKPGVRYLVQARVAGIPADAPPERRMSNGEVYLRRAWA